MTHAEWLASTDPQRMIDWAESRGHGGLLWDFVVDCCGRVWGDLPGEPFRRVVEHFEQVGIRDIEDSLQEASKALDKLERRLHKAADNGEASKLNRQIGLGKMVWASFDQHDGGNAARSISRDLLEWAEDATAEALAQAELLRRLLPDPSQGVEQTEE